VTLARLRSIVPPVVTPFTSEGDVDVRTVVATVAGRAPEAAAAR